MSHRLRRLQTQTLLRNPDVRSSSRTCWTGALVAVGLRFSTVNRKVTCYQLALGKEVVLSCFAQIFPLTCSYLTFRGDQKVRDRSRAHFGTTQYTLKPWVFPALKLA